jgi:hypothetical protein
MRLLVLRLRINKNVQDFKEKMVEGCIAESRKGGDKGKG